MYQIKKGVIILTKYIVYKITNKLNGEYYIGKEVYKPLDRIMINYKNSVEGTTNWIKGGLHDYIKTNGFENFEFEEIDTYYGYIKMEEFLNKYLKEETNPDKMIYYRQYEYVAKNNGIEID